MSTFCPKGHAKMNLLGILLCAAFPVSRSYDIMEKNT
jgi:hypothetical protein